MKEFIESTYLEMIDGLAGLDNEHGKLSNLAADLQVVANALLKLRSYIQTNPFGSDADEIDFFKHSKPRFYSWNIYLVEKFELLRGIPHGTAVMQRKYLLGELKYITRTRERHISVFRYYHDDETHRDQQYFLRANLEHIREGQEFTLPDPAFSTNMDYLFSKFRALDMLEDFIIEQVQLLENMPQKTAASLRWTGDKVNLVELAYGLFYTAQLNDGKAGIMNIIVWLRDTLAVPITREQAYRIWLDIRRRKSIPYTKFIDEMHEAINKQIDDELQLRKAGRRG